MYRTRQSYKIVSTPQQRPRAPLDNGHGYGEGDINWVTLG